MVCKLSFTTRLFYPLFVFDAHLNRSSPQNGIEDEVVKVEKNHTLFHLTGQL